MKILKIRNILCGIFLAPLLLLCGCWNYHEISDVTFIAGAGVDLAPEGAGYTLTLETVDFSESDGGSAPSSRIITVTAPTIPEAVELANAQVTAPLYWNHAGVLVVGTTLAESGVGEVVSFALHNLDTALNLRLMAAAEGDARDIFSLKVHGTPLVSVALREILQDDPYFGETVPARLYEELTHLSAENSTTLLATVSAVKQGEEQIAQVRGSAVLQGTRLISSLDGEQTAQVQALRGELAQHSLHVECEGMPVMVELLNVRRHIVSSQEGLTIEIDAGFALTETATLLENAPEALALGDAAAAALESELTDILSHARDALGCDLFGLDDHLRRHEPAEYARLIKQYGDWNAAFQSLNVRVTVRARAVRGATGPVGRT